MSLKDLIEKYDIQAPRYTSYPPVPFWKGAPTEKTWFKNLQDEYNPEKGIDLYVHIPFCESLCWYCGCNRIIKKDKSVELPYIEAVLKEWELYKKQFMETPIIHALHLGGGTPTFLTPRALDYLLESLLQNKHADFVGSIEIDPRTCNKEHLDVLKKYGFSRISMGIQDFDQIVQKTINRHQSFELVSNLTELIRKMDLGAINYDLIYGLPKQNKKGLKNTLVLVNQLKPEHVAFYSYAHVPWKISNQKLIHEEDLPLQDEKLELYLMARDFFLDNGYVDIGMDHFALKGSPLGQALLSKKIVRNFMGYTDDKSNIILGLGVSSISSSGVSFIQNEKELNPYLEKVNQGALAISSGHKHLSSDIMTEKLIQDIMCKGEWERPTYMDNKKADQILAGMAKDGLVEIGDNKFKVTDIGKPFLRNMAMLYDQRLLEKMGEGRFSRTI